MFTHSVYSLWLSELKNNFSHYTVIRTVGQGAGICTFTLRRGFSQTFLQPTEMTRAYMKQTIPLLRHTNFPCPLRHVCVLMSPVTDAATREALLLCLMVPV